MAKHIHIHVGTKDSSSTDKAKLQKIRSTLSDVKTKIFGLDTDLDDILTGDKVDTAIGEAESALRKALAAVDRALG